MAIADCSCTAAPPCDAATALLDALHGCCHPRVERLKARLAGEPDAEQFAVLRSEVLNVLALSFGTAEAQRRLQAVQ